MRTEEIIKRVTNTLLEIGAEYDLSIHGGDEISAPNYKALLIYVIEEWFSDIATDIQMAHIRMIVTADDVRATKETVLIEYLTNLVNEYERPKTIHEIGLEQYRRGKFVKEEDVPYVRETINTIK